MDIGRMLEDSVKYTRDTLWGEWKRWFLLILSSIVFPFILGYTMEIYRGKYAPELEDWSKLFIDGLKYIAASLIYGIPVLLIMLFFGGFAFLGFAGGAAIQGNPALFISALIAFIVGIILAVIVAIIITFISTIGIVRMARTDRFGEAFNFSAILATIRSIGWGHYILALLVLWAVSFIFSAVLSAFAGIPVLGWIIWLLALPAIAIFEARYIYLVYMNDAPETVAESREYPKQPAGAEEI